MGDARDVLASAIITTARYDLRDANVGQWTAAELLAYLNRCLELIHEILVDFNAELIATGSGTITLADGTEAYDLSSNSMGDFWAPFRIFSEESENAVAVYLTDADGNVYEPLEIVEYADRFAYLQSGSTAESRPTGIYLKGDYMGFLPVPEATYTATIPAYFPNFTPLSAATENMPLKNIFNMQVIEGIKLIAKHREAGSVTVEAALMEVFQQRAWAILQKRVKRGAQVRVRKR